MAVILAYARRPGCRRVVGLDIVWASLPLHGRPFDEAVQRTRRLPRSALHGRPLGGTVQRTRRGGPGARR